MRVGMEEAVIDDLRHVALRQPAPECGRVVALGAQRGQVVDVRALHVLHDQHLIGAELRVRAGALHMGLARQLGAEALQVSQLHGEIQLLGRRARQLVHQIAQREHDAVGHVREVGQRQRVPDERDVLGHLLHHVRAAHLHGHHRPLRRCGAASCRVRRGPLLLCARRHRVAQPLRQPGTMHLRYRGRAQGLLLDVGERLAPWVPERFLDRLHDHLERHGRHVGAQLLERIGIGLGNDIAAIRGDLPHLHECGSQILENGRGLLGRQAGERVMGAEYLLYLMHAATGRVVFDGDLGRTQHLAERGHVSPPRHGNRPIVACAVRARLLMPSFNSKLKPGRRPVGTAVV